MKVIWPGFNTERNPENLAMMIYTLADTDFMRWLSENMEFGDEAQLAFLEEKYSWELDEDLPDWLEETGNRLLLIKELLKKKFITKLSNLSRSYLLLKLNKKPRKNKLIFSNIITMKRIVFLTQFSFVIKEKIKEERRCSDEKFER